MNFLNRIPTSVLLALLLILSLGVRLFDINGNDIAGDEPFSIFMAQFDVRSIITHLSSGNNPPLFEILLHYYMLWVGDSDFLLRLFSSVLGALTVVPMVLIGERFFDRRITLTASLLFIFSICQIRFAHEVRVYSLFSLTTASALYFFLSAMRKPNGIGAWFGLLLCNVILLYSHFTSFYIILIEVVCGAIFIPHRQWKHLMGTMALTAICYAPYLLIFIQRLGDVSAHGTWVAKPGWGELYGSINLMLNDRLTTLFVLVSGIVGMGVSFKVRLTDRLKTILSDSSGLAILLWFALPYTLMFCASMVFMPMFIDRYLLFTSIPLFLTVAWLINLIWRKTRFRWMGALIVIVGSLVTTDLAPTNYRSIKAAVAHIQEARVPDDRVYICPDFFDLGFTYYYNHDWFCMLGTPFPGDPKSAVDSIMEFNRIFPIKDVGQIQTEHIGRVIYLDAASQFAFPDNGILDTLKDRLQLIDSTHFDRIFNVYTFEPTVD